MINKSQPTLYITFINFFELYSDGNKIRKVIVSQDNKILRSLSHRISDELVGITIFSVQKQETLRPILNTTPLVIRTRLPCIEEIVPDDENYSICTIERRKDFDYPRIMR